MTFTEWLQTGIDNGWCGPVLCFTHDDIGLTPSEEEQFEEGIDPPCVGILRLYENSTMKAEIEQAHLPSRLNSRNQ